MGLSKDLISQFVKTTKDEPKKSKETTVYGTIQKNTDGVVCAKLDGSDILTPVKSTVLVEENDRVTVMIKNHTATVTGNLTDPAANEGIIEAEKGRIDELETANLTVQNTLTAQDAVIKNLDSTYASFDYLGTNYLSAGKINSDYAKISDLDAAVGRIGTLESNSVTTAYLTSNYITADEIESTYVTATKLAAEYTKTETLESNYAKVNLANVKTADIGTVLANVGLITSATIVDGHVTGYLDSVQVNANDITAGTLTVDRLVISGTDKSIVYALNNAGDLTSTEVDTINGDVITKRTIAADHIIAGAITANELHSESVTSDKIASKAVTAGKINVTSLESIVAKIGSFDINNSLYSNNHSAYNTASNGVYIGSDYISLGNGGKTWLKNDGSVSIGDGAINYNATNGVLDINASSIKMASQTLALKTDVDNVNIGGRNLLPNTDFNGVSKRHERLTGAGTEGGFHFYPTEQIESEQEYVISCSIRGNANINFYQINSSGGNVSIGWIWRNMLSETEYRDFNLVFKVDASRVFKNGYICTMWGEDNTLVGDWFEIKPKSLKLERGNKATDWTPAPEDVESDILNASKIATNYLNFSSSGLVIGDLTSSTLGKNVLIDSESVKIRTGNTENAKFGADIIELAKDNESATISMLNGTFKIYYSANTSEAGLGVYGITSDGKERLAFQPVNENDNLTIGWGGYDAGKNSTNIYGHNIKLIAGNDMSIENDHWKINIDGNLFGKASNNSFVELIGLSSDNNTAIGHGGYTSSLGKTNIYGNKINHIVNTSRGSATYKPYYEAGDSVEIEWYGAGFISSSAKIVYFTIPLAKPIIGGTTPNVSISSHSTDGGLRIRQDGNYVFGSASDTHIAPSSYKAQVSGDGNMVRIEATMSNNTNASNNAPCGVDARIKLTFS